MKSKQLKDEMFVELCERTMVLWLPVRKSITNLPFKDKCKFWFQLWIPLFISFIAVVALHWIGIILGLALNFWWFSGWNRYLKRYEKQSGVHERHK